MPNWNKAGNIGKHNQSHLILVINLASKSPLCNYRLKCFCFQGSLKLHFLKTF